ncbi:MULTISPECIES: monovalent cation:proton antiporter family protein [unclassified Hahella]|uniref:monovalent cation:proton antiporter family protein n=1 Tax=unclassified Hahella TaxID=2624107 RepID=UPI001C1E9E79|nr:MULTISPECIES: monovalent cation:proton antiporter family protein [unclassified Hahella]MBU6954680.1 monovalent cation:proton antiporter-2 (CPA2) family protein [Hahella sp. HN01]MDG9668925.1 monovalent cation:proton antiporter-2 (CPA2) family protein [Hahella sp. CR1]
MHEANLSQFLVLITAAVVVSSLFRRMNIPSVLAYLAVGLGVGPTALGWVDDVETIQVLAEFGVVFLLFSLGLEFSLAKMIALRKVVFNLGGWQVAVSSLVIFGIARLFKASTEEAIIIAGALALSSTAVVSKELVQRNELGQPHGVMSMGVLLFQDLAAVIFLILIPFLAGGSDSSLAAALAITLGKGALLFALMLAIGKYLLPFIFTEVAKSHSEELFVLTVLMVSLLAAALTHSFGLSMALGAFIAGMMLSETHYKHQIEADIRPFRDLLLGLFFISVGMIVDFQEVLANWPWIILITAMLLLAKATLIGALAYRHQKDRAVALKTGLYLAQGGEFGFALFALGEKFQLISKQAGAVVITTVILSITLTPWLMNLARYLSARFPSDKGQSVAQTRMEALTDACSELEGHAIVCGFGRVGQTVARFMRRSSMPMTAVDKDPVRVKEAAAAGEPVHYGDSERLDILKALGLERSRLLIITYADVDKSLAVIRKVRSTGSNVPILVRTADDSKMSLLQEAGATEIVPETLEASLMLVTQVLTLMGAPARKIHRQIEEVRRSRYKMLHGYYPGINSQLVGADGTPLEKLHALTLPDGAYSCHRSLAQMKLAACNVDSIRRGDEEFFDPAGDFILQPGDTLILHGSADQVEQAENKLLGG